MKYGFVYIWRDRKHKRSYIGCHFGNIEDNYICSSRWMRKSYRRRPNDFKRRIIISNIKSRLETFIEEQRWLNFIKDEELGKRYYNLTKCYVNHFSIVENKRLTMTEKISKKNIGNKYHLGKHHSDKTKKQMSEKRKGKTKPPRTEEHRMNLSISQKGKPKNFSEEAYRNVQKGQFKPSNFMIINPDKKTYEIQNLRKFCKENNLDSSHICRKYGSKGYRVIKINIVN